MKMGIRLQALSEWVETKTGRTRLEVQRVELRKLIRIAEAAAAVAEYDQTYEGHEDDSREEGPLCTICGEKDERMYALADALAALEQWAERSPVDTTGFHAPECDCPKCEAKLL